MITQDQLQPTSDAFLFSTEASIIGLKPAEWPETLSTNVGNSRPFIRGNRHVLCGNLVAVSYSQESGCTKIVIYND